MASTINADTKLLATNATSTATVPAITAPMIGMNAPRNTSAASGTASGTPTMASPMPMPTASTTATAAVARTYFTSDEKPRLPATSTLGRTSAGMILIRNDQMP